MNIFIALLLKYYVLFCLLFQIYNAKHGTADDWIGQNNFVIISDL